MISTTPKNSHLFLKLLLIAAALYAYKNRAGISAYLSRNETLQEAKSSIKWLYNELRPSNEAEKKQHESYTKLQQKRAAERRELGIKPHIEFVDRTDKAKRDEAAKDWQSLRKDLMRGID